MSQVHEARDGQACLCLAEACGIEAKLGEQLATGLPAVFDGLRQALGKGHRQVAEANARSVHGWSGCACSWLTAGRLLLCWLPGRGQGRLACSREMAAVWPSWRSICACN